MSTKAPVMDSLIASALLQDDLVHVGLGKFAEVLSVETKKDKDGNRQTHIELSTRSGSQTMIVPSSLQVECRRWDR